jgi:hypothetical protein
VNYAPAQGSPFNAVKIKLDRYDGDFFVWDGRGVLQREPHGSGVSPTSVPAFCHAYQRRTAAFAQMRQADAGCGVAVVIGDVRAGLEPASPSGS